MTEFFEVNLLERRFNNWTKIESGIPSTHQVTISLRARKDRHNIFFM